MTLTVQTVVSGSATSFLEAAPYMRLQGMSARELSSTQILKAEKSIPPNHTAARNFLSQPAQSSKYLSKKFLLDKLDFYDQFWKLLFAQL